MTPSFIKGFIVTLIIIVAADLFWHAWLMADFYNSHLSAINGAPESLAFPPFVLLFEVVAALCITYFVQGTLRNRSIVGGALRGAALGLLITCSINFVDHSVIMKWDLTLAFVDIVWGIVTGLIAGGVLAAMSKKRA